MLAFKSASSSGTIERSAGDVTAELDERVSAVHRLINQQMMTGHDFVVPRSPLEQALETASRWAAYPALAIAAICIGLLTGTVRF